ncbi:cysteine--tRNA ligase [Candidatus Woesearchaeota archaeon]|nr:cysteine--tRNA ligase [Candidatus Woesearchaeota archaeon]
MTTKLQLYNTLTRKKEVFSPIKKSLVGMYCCGPTVYHYAHIGNLRAYIFNDVLRRALAFNGFKVKHVMNITDVGHLTSDADEGEDKMAKGAAREGKTVWEVAKFYEEEFFRDTEALGILKPDVICRATDHIKEMIELVKRIEKNGYTYVSEGNVYFDTSKFNSYYDLCGHRPDEDDTKARVEEDSAKKNKSDFVLWFTQSKFGNQDMQWDSPWGRGFPGWHLECSAMSIKYLGEQFDIHCGGIDHIPIHHTNEIAQSEAATGKKPWVKYWMHNEFLVMDKEKMSKSSGDFLRMQTILDKGYDPVVYRYFCLGAQYRQQLKFAWEGMDGARNAFNRLKENVLMLKEQALGNESSGQREKTDDYMEEFKTAINDDLNTSAGLAIMWSVVRDEELTAGERLELLYKFDSVLGLGIEGWEREKVDVPADVQKLVAEREEARKKKDWKKADELRDKMAKAGFSVKDTPEGPKLSRV